jgi:ribonuclease HI
VITFCDSKLVVEQVNQKWQVNSDELRPLMSKAYGLLVQGCHVLKHCKGHSGIQGNEKADELCNKELDNVTKS